MIDRHAAAAAVGDGSHLGHEPAGRRAPAVGADNRDGHVAPDLRCLVLSHRSLDECRDRLDGLFDEAATRGSRLRGRRGLVEGDLGPGSQVWATVWGPIDGGPTLRTAMHQAIFTGRLVRMNGRTVLRGVVTDRPAYYPMRRLLQLALWPLAAVFALSLVGFLLHPGADRAWFLPLWSGGALMLIRLLVTLADRQRQTDGRYLVRRMAEAIDAVSLTVEAEPVPLLPGAVSRLVARRRR